jgi:hypothetical protein
MRQILSLVFLALIISVHGQSLNSQSTGQQNNAKKNIPDFNYKIIPSINNTWCYDIYKNNKMLIHQANIPGLPGNEGFKKKSDAGKVARLVIEKLEKGEMPPSVTVDEMKKLKVL